MKKSIEKMVKAKEMNSVFVNYLFSLKSG